MTNVSYVVGEVQGECQQRSSKFDWTWSSYGEVKKKLFNLQLVLSSPGSLEAALYCVALIKASTLSSSLGARPEPSIVLLVVIKYSSAKGMAFNTPELKSHHLYEEGLLRTTLDNCDSISEFVLWLTQDSKLEIYFPVGHNFYLDGSVKEGEGGGKPRLQRGGGRGRERRGPRSCSVWHHEDPGPALLRHSHKVHPAPPAALQRLRERVLQQPGKLQHRLGGLQWWRYEAWLRWQDSE